MQEMMSSPHPPPLFLSFFLCLLVLSSLPPAALSYDDPNGFVYAGCSQLKYAADMPYQYNLNSLLASLANAASFSPYANFTSAIAAPSAPVYGLYQCRGDLPVPDCESCVRSSINQFSSLCSSSCGGALQLQGCFVRFGNESFLGQPDKTLLYKHCGGAATGGYDLAGMQDSAVAGLAAAGGANYYRVSRAGYVEATAQCVGDLSQKACDDCVAYATSTLRAACGGAASGEVYLGKCYAKYSSRGVDTSRSNHGSNGDEAGKTLAIIIGLMAGVVLVIVFLSFLRRAAEGDKGKY